MKEILILGTGKMARNIGLYFLKNDCHVSWVSRDSSRAELFSNQLKKDIRRLALVLDKQPDDFKTYVNEISNILKKKYDLILESIEENLTHKKEVIQTVKSLLTSDTILASNSSSFLPSQIHRSVIGLHFFYPVELIGLLEIITNSNIKMEKIQGLVDQFKSWDINTIVQAEHNAFAVNRLLLPVQAESFRLLQEGYPAEMINECSKSDQIKIGQLELMDSIGLDVLLPAIKNYVSRMPLNEQRNYDGLLEGLNILVQKGNLGKKNKNGIMMGNPLPWEKVNSLSEQSDQIKKIFSDLFRNTCQHFINGRQIGKNDLNTVVSTLFN